jgi:hypothetical protein
VSDALAIELVHALFCGLRRREFRVAVFVCAADESADENPRRNFCYGGFAAPVTDWDGPFLSAWTARVLDGPPRIPYMHMTDMLTPAWRRKHGLADSDVAPRLTAASEVIGTHKSLMPMCWWVKDDDFKRIVKQPALANRGLPLADQPDYLMFLALAVSTLDRLHKDHGAELEKVDFWTECNGKITDHIKRFHAHLPDILRGMGRDDLVPLIGELLPVGKGRIPVQAADFLLWHTRRDIAGTLDSDAARRHHLMVANRRGLREDIGIEMLTLIGHLLASPNAKW